MKKFISVILCFVTIFAMAVPTFAATLNENNTSGNMIADYKAGYTADDKGTEDPTDDDVVGSYTVTIPSYIVVTAQGKDLAPQTVKINDAMLLYDTIMYISITYGSLKCGRQSLGYKFQRADDGSSYFINVDSGSNIIEVRAGTPSVEKHMNLCAVLTESPVFAGNYKDTVVFNVTVR